MIYRMLEYLYMQEYTVDLGFDPFWSVNDSWAQSRLHVHAQMYSLGDKYDLAGLKKEAGQRFIDDITIPGDKKRETLTLLSVIPTIYTTTLDSDRGLRDLVAWHTFQRYRIASKYFIKELDSALKVPQFAQDIVMLDRNRPAMDSTALGKKFHRYWHRCLQTLRRAASLFNTAAFSIRVLASRITLNGMRHLLALALVSFLLVVMFTALFLIGVTMLAPFLDFAMRLQCANCEAFLWRDCQFIKEILALTECGGT